PRAAASAPDADLVAQLKAAVLRMDDAILALNKPAGIACQGGSKTRRHIAGAAPALAFDADEPPRLVHRLDRDTTGVLLLARSRAAAEALSDAFEARAVEKTYWAIVVGEVGTARKGVIDAPLGKRPGPGGEKMAVDAENGLPAETKWSVLDRGRDCALLALKPLTGRTHQLRVHCAAMGWPILGDGKYGGAAAFLNRPGVGSGLRLHAKRLALPHPLSGRPTDFDADPPAAFLSDLKALKLDPQARRR
ncbi:MAG: RNA pseudouridine synthase, partial [Pseudomonadota bacterium]